MRYPLCGNIAVWDNQHKAPSGKENIRFLAPGSIDYCSQGPEVSKDAYGITRVAINFGEYWIWKDYDRHE